MKKKGKKQMEAESGLGYKYPQIISFQPGSSQ